MRPHPEVAQGTLADALDRTSALVAALSERLASRAQQNAFQP